jgi:hypothetical protein
MYAPIDTVHCLLKILISLITYGASNEFRRLTVLFQVLKQIRECRNVIFTCFQFPCMYVYIANVSSQCFGPASPTVSGFWTAERRQDVYATNQTVCMASPFVWIKDNTTSGQLPEQSWEATSGMRAAGQPDCSSCDSKYGILETCIQLRSIFNYAWNDVNCYVLQCPLCQLDTIRHENNETASSDDRSTVN